MKHLQQQQVQGQTFPSPSLKNTLRRQKDKPVKSHIFCMTTATRRSSSMHRGVIHEKFMTQREVKDAQRSFGKNACVANHTGNGRFSLHRKQKYHKGQHGQQQLLLRKRFQGTIFSGHAPISLSFYSTVMFFNEELKMMSKSIRTCPGTQKKTP